jgi:malonate-semialdehyde dehydrogenase (acetylating)/methylmalonate-semialdehyde dehydrogenase
VVAVESIADELVRKIEERIPQIKVGPSSDPDAEMGPLITGEHRDRVASYMEGSQAQGATLRVDGREHELWGTGFFFGPALIDNVTTEMDCYRDEIFGRS